MQLIGQYLAYFFDDISWKMEDIGIFAGLKVQMHNPHQKYSS